MAALADPYHRIADIHLRGRCFSFGQVPLSVERILSGCMKMRSENDSSGAGRRCLSNTVCRTPPIVGG